MEATEAPWTSSAVHYPMGASRLVSEGAAASLGPAATSSPPSPWLVLRLPSCTSGRDTRRGSSRGRGAAGGSARAECPTDRWDSVASSASLLRIPIGR